MSKYESSLYTNVEDMAVASTLRDDDSTNKDVQSRDSRV